MGKRIDHLRLVDLRSLVLLAACGACAHKSSYTMDSAEWAPLDRAITDAGWNMDALNEGRRAVIRVGAATQPDHGAWKADPLYIISFPVFLIWNGLRHTVVTDIDSMSRPRFETCVVYGPSRTEDDMIADDELFEIVINYLAIDSFTEGRLRDAWGGEGGQVSMQASMNAISRRGMLLRDDTRFVIENEVKRRSALFALAKGTAKGREFTNRVEDEARELTARLKELKLDVASITSYAQRIHRAVGDRSGECEKAQQEALALVDRWVATSVTGADEQAFTKQVAQSIVSALFGEIRNHLDDTDVNDDATWVTKVVNEAGRHTREATAVLDFLGRVAVDEQGIYETAQVIVGLADADRVATMEFENVKPSLWQFGGEASGGTAATLIGDDFSGIGERVMDTASRESETDLFRVTARDRAVDAKPGEPLNIGESVASVMSPRNLVYRGDLKSLSRNMEGVKGFSLSFLMLDRADDRVVRALRALQQVADQRGLSIGGGGSQIDVSALLDGLAALAQKIAEDKVELRAIDLRFMNAEPERGATPGKEVFALRPCTILISRNLDGVDFGAVAEVSIRRSHGRSARDAAGDE